MKLLLTKEAVLITEMFFFISNKSNINTNYKFKLKISYFKKKKILCLSASILLTKKNVPYFKLVEENV